MYVLQILDTQVAPYVLADDRHKQKLKLIQVYISTNFLTFSKYTCTKMSITRIPCVAGTHVAAIVVSTCRIAVTWVVQTLVNVCQKYTCRSMCIKKTG